MKIKFNELELQINFSKSSLYIIYGNEYILIKEAFDKIKEMAYLSNFKEHVFFIINNNFNWENLISISQSYSIFENKKFIDLRFLSKKINKEDFIEIKSLVKLIKNNAVIVITILNINTEIKNTLWFKEMINISVAIQVNKIKNLDLLKWINKKILKQGQYLEEGKKGERSLKFIAKNVEGNLLAANQEINKLKLLYSPGILKYEQIYSSITNLSRYSIFELIESMIIGNTKKVSYILNSLYNDRESPELILWYILKYIRILINIKDNESNKEALQKILYTNYILKEKKHIIISAINKISKTILESIISIGSQIDIEMKGIIDISHNENQYLLPSNYWNCLFELTMRITILIKESKKYYKLSRFIYNPF